MSKIENAAHELGPEGPGVAVLSEFISPSIYYPLIHELSNPSIPFSQPAKDFVNERGVQVYQDFEVFGHKVSRGEQSILSRLPMLCWLGNIVATEIIEPLKSYYPNLKDWQTDECVVQRYRPQEGRLTWHYDLERHTGVIAICNVMGRANFYTRSQDWQMNLGLNLGDVVLLRTIKLYDSIYKLRTEHAIENSGEFNRISVTFRSNNLPNEPIPNFHYHNWPD